MVKKLLLAIVSLTLALLLAEAGLRLAGIRPLQIRSISQENFERVPGMYEPGLHVVSRKIPQLPHEVSVNALGFRGPETTIAPTRPRILAIGDSFTWGDGVDDDETLPSQLQQMLGDRVEILNGGVAGSTISDQRQFLERLLVLRPTAVLLVYSENDLQDLLADPSLSERLRRARRARSGWTGVVYSHIRSTAIVELALRAKEAWRSRRLVARIQDQVAHRHWNDALLERYTREVSQMRDELTAKGIRLLVAAYPWPEYVTSEETGSIPPLTAALSRVGIDVVDLTEPLRRSHLGETDLYLLPYDGHPAAKGYAIAAAALEPHIDRLLAQATAGDQR